jgi:hypothetical protein
LIFCFCFFTSRLLWPSNANSQFATRVFAILDAEAERVALKAKQLAAGKVIFGDNDDEDQSETEAADEQSDEEVQDKVEDDEDEDEDDYDEEEDDGNVDEESDDDVDDEAELKHKAPYHGPNPQTPNNTSRPDNQHGNKSQTREPNGYR